MNVLVKKDKQQLKKQKYHEKKNCRQNQEIP
jgi:hypothetical protein